MSLLTLSLFIAFAENPLANVSELVRAEIAFAQLTAQEGIPAGFLAYLDEGALVFAPEPTDARAYYANQEPGEGKLRWQPSHSELSASGDFGFNFGPYEFKADGKPETKGFYGSFISVWLLKPNGWHLALDFGCPHQGSASDFANIQLVSKSLPAVPRSQTEADLVQVDRHYASEVSTLGPVPALKKRLAADGHVFRFKQMPQNAVEFAKTPASELGKSYETLAGKSARSGDLGYSYGKYKELGPEGKEGYYLHIWRRSGEIWELVVVCWFSGKRSPVRVNEGKIS